MSLFAKRHIKADAVHTAKKESMSRSQNSLRLGMYMANSRVATNRLGKNLNEKK